MVPADQRQGRGCGRERACASIWVLPYGLFFSRVFPAAPEKTSHHDRNCLLGADSPACPPFRGQTAPPPPRPARGARPPSSPLGPRRVLSLTSGVCVAERACVSVVKEGALQAAPSVRFIRDTLIYNQIHLIKFLLKGIISLQRSSTCFKQHDKL